MTVGSSSEPLQRPPQDVVVVGGGITGLAAAHRLRRDFPGIGVRVLEASDRLGGKILTAPFAGMALDAAADAFLARVPEATALCEELGLGDQLVEPAARTAELWCRGSLRPLPEGLVLGVPTDLDALEASGVVSSEGVERAGLDLSAPEDGPAGDESVGSLVRRRLGDEVFEMLVAPLLGGVNAGDADSLSLEAGAPQLAAAARRGPSLIEGVRSLATKAGAKRSAPVFKGLLGGTSQLVDALGAALGPGTVHTSTSVESVVPTTAGRYRIPIRHSSGGSDVLEADGVVLAVPSHSAAELVSGLQGETDHLVEVLTSLEWASVVLALLDVPLGQIQHPLEASGYLVPVPERRTVTACSFASSKWAHLSRPGRALLRVSAGHAGDDEPVYLDDDELMTRVLADLGEHLGLEGDPAEVRVTRWPRSLPQYRPGHIERVSAARQELWDQHPGIWLAGASFEGLGLPACIRQGWEAARRVGGPLSQR